MYRRTERYRGCTFSLFALGLYRCSPVSSPRLLEDSMARTSLGRSFGRCDEIFRWERSGNNHHGEWAANQPPEKFPFKPRIRQSENPSILIASRQFSSFLSVLAVAIGIGIGKITLAFSLSPFAFSAATRSRRQRRCHTIQYLSSSYFFALSPLLLLAGSSLAKTTGR